MPILVFFLVAVMAVVAQTTFLQALPSFLGCPDLVFTLVVFIAYRFAWLPGLLLVFCTAWMLEATVGYRLGIYAIQCLVVFTFLKTITRNIPIRESFYQVPLGILAFVLSRVFSSFLISMTGDEPTAVVNWWPLLRDTLWFILVACGLFKALDALLSSAERFSRRGRPAVKSANIRRDL
ncbi:MAG: hypothetical protein LBU39_10190 [Desulfobulbaceae bacterium]|jgi:hypothetical protein|nr:hypothetical protein [Desulfobulbaceae bacterium]